MIKLEKVELDKESTWELNVWIALGEYVLHELKDKIWELSYFSLLISRPEFDGYSEYFD